MQLSPHLHALRIPFTVSAGPVVLERFVYAYVIVADRVWLVDTGVAGSAPKLLALLAELGRTAPEVAGILLTHSHVDHIGSAKALTEATHAPVYAHQAERRWIEDIAAQAKERPVPGFEKLCDRGVTVDRSLVDEQVLELSSSLHLRVIAAPGHSPGGVCFLIEEQGLLITGDAIPVQGDMPVYDDPDASAHSVARLRNLRDLQIVASAWDRPHSGGEIAAALARGAEVIEDVHQAVRQAATSPESDAMGFCKEVVASLGMPPPFANPMCLRTFMGHWRLRERASLLDQRPGAANE